MTDIYFSGLAQVFEPDVQAWSSESWGNDPCVLVFRNVRMSLEQYMNILQGGTIYGVFNHVVVGGMTGVWSPVLSDPLVPYIAPPRITRMIFVRDELHPVPPDKVSEFLELPEWKS